MDAAATTAGWLSFLVTAVGLGSLITQASAIQDRLDPYHTSRTEEHLGAWRKRQPKRPGIDLRSLHRSVLLYPQSSLVGSVVSMSSATVGSRLRRLEKPAGPLFWRSSTSEHHLQFTSPIPEPTERTPRPKSLTGTWRRTRRPSQ